MKRRRRKAVQPDAASHGLSPDEHVCEILRDIQWKTNCSTLTLQTVLDSIRGKLGSAVRRCKDSGAQLPRSVEWADKKMRSVVCLLHQKVLFINVEIVNITNAKIIH